MVRTLFQVGTAICRLCIKWQKGQVSSQDFFLFGSVAKLYLILCDHIDCSLPGSSVHGTFQAKILEWVTISFSRGSSDPGIESASLMSPVLTGGFFTTSSTWESPCTQPINSSPNSNLKRCIPMFITALLTIVKTWKQPKCPSKDEWIQKIKYKVEH